MLALWCVLPALYITALTAMLTLGETHDKTARYHLYGGYFAAYLVVYYLVMPFKFMIDDLRKF